MSVDDVAIKRLVQQHWSRRAPTFDEGLTHALHSEAQREAWLAVMRELAGSRPLRVLDLGCGTGFLALLLAGLGHTVTGLDFA
ncbi:MAG: class I SAM-dependent methyltransferase, partial [Ktedonobacterales bacterium]